MQTFDNKIPLRLLRIFNIITIILLAIFVKPVEIGIFQKLPEIPAKIISFTINIVACQGIYGISIFFLALFTILILLIVKALGGISKEGYNNIKIIIWNHVGSTFVMLLLMPCCIFILVVIYAIIWLIKRLR